MLLSPPPWPVTPAYGKGLFLNHYLRDANPAVIPSKFSEAASLSKYFLAKFSMTMTLVMSVGPKNIEHYRLQNVLLPDTLIAYKDKTCNNI